MSKQEFLKAVTYMGIVFNKDINKVMIETWYEFFIDISESSLKKAIKELVKNSKYLPSLQELLEMCSQLEINNLNSTIREMYNDGYFSIGLYNTLSDDQAFRNYEKAIMWLEQGIIPEWLKKDMEEYKNKINKLEIESSGRLQLMY